MFAKFETHEAWWGACDDDYRNVRNDGEFLFRLSRTFPDLLVISYWYGGFRKVLLKPASNSFSVIDSSYRDRTWTDVDTFLDEYKGGSLNIPIRPPVRNTA